MGLCAALALTLLAQLPVSTEAELPGGEHAQLQADQLTYEPDAHVLTAKGHTVLRTERLILRADSVEYDEVHQKAKATGNVMFAAGSFAAIADQVTVDIPSQEAEVEGGLFMQKKNVSPERLFAATTQRELKALGETTIAISGKKIRRIGPDEFEVVGLSFTPCDCKPTDPSWRVESAKAHITMNDRAELLFPVIYVFKIPVFAFPWISMPVTDRAAGLLVPRPVTTSLNGWSVDVPFFVPLGPSYDFTVTPGYYFGASPVAAPDQFAFPADQFPPKSASNPDGLALTNPYGIKGPRLSTEFRYAPTPDVHGKATVDLIDDQLPQRDPFNPNAVGAVGGPTLEWFKNFPDPASAAREFVRTVPIRGLRWEASWQHDQSLGNGWYDKVDASALSDGYFVKDLQADILLRENQYLRSTATAFHRDDNSYAGLEVVTRQDLRWGSSFTGFDRAVTPDPDTGQLLPERGPNIFDRLPNLHLGIPAEKLWGPIFGSLSAEATRTSPMFHLFGDEGTDGVFQPSTTFDPKPPFFDLDNSQGNGRFDPGVPTPLLLDKPGVTNPLPGEREARDRIDVMPKATASFGLGDVARLTATAAFRQDVWRGEVTGLSYARGYPLLDLLAASELSRTFGTTHGIRHAIVPFVELRTVPFVFGSPPPVAYDEIDASIPPGGLAQAVAGVRQRLWVRDGAAVREVGRLDLTQDVDFGRLLGFQNPLGLDAPRPAPLLGDTSARLVLTLDRLTADVLGRYNVSDQRLDQVSASIDANDGHGGALYLRFDHLVTDGPETLRAGIDALVGLPSSLLFPCNTEPKNLVADPNTFSSSPVQTPLVNHCYEQSEQLIAGFRKDFKFGLGLRYEAIVRPLYNPFGLNTSGGTPEIVRGNFFDKVSQQVVGVSYGPACDCWRIEAHAIIHPRDLNTNIFPKPDFGFTFTIARFGSFGNGR